ncbi:hypothetical protein R6Q57_010450 [Mikania cordata]
MWADTPKWSNKEESNKECLDATPKIKSVVEAVMKTHGVDNSPDSGIEGLSDERSQRTRILDEENASIPTFSLGLTQEKEEKGKTKTDKIDEMIDASIPSFSMGLTQETQDKGYNEAFSIPLGEEHVHKNENVVLLNKPTRAKIISAALRSPYVIREVEINKSISKEEELIWNYISGRKKKLHI